MARYVQNLYEQNYKLLLKDTKVNMNKGKDIHYSLLGYFNIIKKSIHLDLLKIVYNFNINFNELFYEARKFES